MIILLAYIAAICLIFAVPDALATIWSLHRPRHRQPQVAAILHQDSHIHTCSEQCRLCEYPNHHPLDGAA